MKLQNNILYAIITRDGYIKSYAFTEITAWNDFFGGHSLRTTGSEARQVYEAIGFRCCRLSVEIVETLKTEEDRLKEL